MKPKPNVFIKRILPKIKSYELRLHEKPFVSVIITTRNSERTLNKCLKSIVNQSYKNIELIVVDNNSTDNTKRIAQKYTKLLFNKGPERSAQRNYGAKKAKGKYLIIHDSDIYFDKNSIKQCVKLADKTGCKAIILPEKSVGKGYWAKVKAFERTLYVGNDLIEAARFFDKKTFLKLGGYDESLTGPEDWDLSIRFREANFDILRIKTYLIHDEGKVSFLGSSKKKKYYSKSFDKYRKKHPDWYKEQMTFFKRFNKKNLFKNLINHPILTISMLLMKGIEWFYVKN